jgi:uncharacterized small protein (DUF1192 family)
MANTRKTNTLTATKASKPIKTTEVNKATEANKPAQVTQDDLKQIANSVVALREEIANLKSEIATLKLSPSTGEDEVMKRLSAYAAYMKNKKLALYLDTSINNKLFL